MKDGLLKSLRGPTATPQISLSGTMTSEPRHAVPMVHQLQPPVLRLPRALAAATRCAPLVTSVALAGNGHAARADHRRKLHCGRSHWQSTAEANPLPKLCSQVLQTHAADPGGDLERPASPGFNVRARSSLCRQPAEPSQRVDGNRAMIQAQPRRSNMRLDRLTDHGLCADSPREQQPQWKALAAPAPAMLARARAWVSAENATRRGHLRGSYVTVW